MAKSKRNLIYINLLISQTELARFYLKPLRWILSSGRFIIILVEFVVIGGFVLRFKLDSDLVDLQDKIKEQLPYIQSLRSDEIQVRQTQFQLQTAKQVRLDNQNLSAALTKVAQATPRNVRTLGVNLDRSQAAPKTTLRILAVAGSNYEVSAFVKALQADQSFSAVSLASITFEKPLINFTITGVFNNSVISSKSL